MEEKRTKIYMKLIVDVISFIFMFLFAYAFGRKSESDGKPVVPLTVTWFTILMIFLIMLLLNIPFISKIMKLYSGGVIVLIDLRKKDLYTRNKKKRRKYEKFLDNKLVAKSVDNVEED